MPLSDAEKREIRDYVEDLLKHDEAVKSAVIEALTNNLAAFAQVVGARKGIRGRVTWGHT